jgi:hypothetical protein
VSAREYAKNLFSTWSDDDFCNQPVFDKLLFQVINGQRTVNTAGVFPINFTRWRKAMRDGDIEPTNAQLRAALERMEARRYVYIDDNTGEGIIRSRIRRDELDKQPTVLLSALRILAAFDSPKFAAVMRDELERITLPVIGSNSDKANALRNNLKRAWDDARGHLQTLSEGFVTPSVLDPLETLSEPSLEAIGDQGKQDSPETLSRPSLEGPVSGSGSVSVSTSSSVGDWVGEKREDQTGTGQPGPKPDRNAPPADRCPKHINDEDPPNCGACAGHRRRRERWDAQAAERAAEQRAAARREILDCPDCDDNGLIDLGNRARRCPKHEPAVTHA